MKINVIFPYNNVGGAFRSTYELSNNLISMGHDVVVYFPFFPYLQGHTFLSLEGFKIFIKGLGRSLIRRNKVGWFDLNAKVTMVPFISNFYIRDADIILGNHWPTISDVSKLNSSKGLKFNFIRDTNPWMYKPELEIETFRADVSRIVVSSWIKEYLNKELNLEVAGIVQNGTNFQDFTYERTGYNSPPTIGMVYYDHPQKGMEDGMEALRKIKEKYSDVAIQIFGLSKPKYIPFDAQFFLSPTKEKLRELYGTSDIFLFPSIQEGSGNPPREAMVSGCALVSTNVGCIPECTIAGETALIVDPGDTESMIAHLADLIENPTKIESIGTSAKEYIKRFTWQESAQKLEKIFVETIDEKNK